MEQNERRVEQVEQGRRKEAGEQKEVEQKSSPRDTSGNFPNAVPNPMPLSLFSPPSTRPTGLSWTTGTEENSSRKHRHAISPSACSDSPDYA